MAQDYDMTLKLCGHHSGKDIHIFNVYNEVGTDTLSVLSESLGRLEEQYEIIMLGDFNLHHPLWSAIHRRAGVGPNPWQQK